VNGVAAGTAKPCKVSGADGLCLTTPPHSFAHCLCDRLAEHDHDHPHEADEEQGSEHMQSGLGEFHWRAGLTFTRLACGCVRIREWERFESGRWGWKFIARIPAQEWESVVQFVSACHRDKGAPA
jgi:hypothetical protein